MISIFGYWNSNSMSVLTWLSSVLISCDLAFILADFQEGFQNKGDGEDEVNLGEEGYEYDNEEEEEERLNC